MASEKLWAVLTPTLITMMMVIAHESSPGILQRTWMDWSHLFQLWCVTSPLLLSQAVTKQGFGLCRCITSQRRGQGMNHLSLAPIKKSEAVLILDTRGRIFRVYCSLQRPLTFLDFWLLPMLKAGHGLSGPLWLDYDPDHPFIL